MYLTLRLLLRRLGTVRATLAVSILSVAISAAITIVIDVALDGAVGTLGILLAVVIPALVSPFLSGITIRLAYQLDEAEQRVHQLAITDELTGAANRRQFFALAGAEFERARRYAQPFAIVIVDLDDFKQVNDTHGHPAGDAVLRALSELCRKRIRVVDTFARYGGEEFVFLMPGTGATEAMAFAERLRVEVAATTIVHAGAQLQVTLSAGVSGWQAGDSDLDALIVRADNALYDAKAKGKNQIEWR
ncbi:MAG: diguanylate cyclase [Chloroflexi bacterium]|nr:diguanylate cyclase [Chloroflexota bacterium]